MIALGVGPGLLRFFAIEKQSISINTSEGQGCVLDRIGGKRHERIQPDAMVVVPFLAPPSRNGLFRRCRGPGGKYRGGN